MLTESLQLDESICVNMKYPKTCITCFLILLGLQFDKPVDFIDFGLPADTDHPKEAIVNKLNILR